LGDRRRLLKLRSLAALAAAVALLWQPAYVLACAVTGVQAYQAGTTEVAAAMERAALSQLGAPYPPLPPLEQGYPAATVRNAPVPCVLLKAIGYVEGSWRQATGSTPDGTSGPVKTSASCGFGIMQITSGMRRTGELPEDTQRQIAADYRYNIAWGARMLAEKWNAMDYLNAAVGDRDPAVAEHWYYAVWAYNQFNFRNNPNNPDYAWPRPAFDGSQNRLGYPYQELVYGFAAHPPVAAGRPLWEATPLALPKREDIGHSPGPIPAPPERHTGACSTLWSDTSVISWKAVKGQPLSQSVAVTNAQGPVVVAWTAIVGAGAPWLQVKPTGGSGLPAQLTVSVNPQALAPGANRGVITIAAAGSLTPITIPVDVVLEDPQPFKRYLPYTPRRFITFTR
jgi:hypothetical protein